LEIIMTVRTTKLALEQQLVAQGLELEALRAKYLELRAAYKAAVDKVEEVTRPAPRAPRTPWQPPAHFVAARKAAMRTGVVIKVTA